MNRNKKSPADRPGGTKADDESIFYPQYTTTRPHNATAIEYQPDYEHLAEVADLETTRWGMIRDLARLDAAIENLTGLRGQP